MSEIPQQPTIEQISPDSELSYLSGQMLRIPAQPVLTRSEAVERFGYNGDVLAVLNLPKDFTGKDLQVGIIDFGEADYDKPEERPPLFILEGKPISLLGKAKSRYGLVGLNYSPADHLGAYAALDSKELTIGRERGVPSNRNLGLIGDGGEPLSRLISQKHLTVQLTPDNKLYVTDHSTNGTTVETASAREQKRSAAGRIFGKIARKATRS